MWRRFSDGGFRLGHRHRWVAARELGISDARLPDLVAPSVPYNGGREERPEVDHDYRNSSQIMTGKKV